MATILITHWGRDKWTPFRRRHFQVHFLEWKWWIPIKISLKFVPKGQINNIPALVKIMAWRRPGDKPLSEPMMVSLPTHICVTRPQWVLIPPRVNPLIQIQQTEVHPLAKVCGFVGQPCVRSNVWKSWITSSSVVTGQWLSRQPQTWMSHNFITQQTRHRE